MDLYLGLRYNSFARIKKFLGVESPYEFLEFWESLTPEEQRLLREVDLYDEQ